MKPHRPMTRLLTIIKVCLLFLILSPPSSCIKASIRHHNHFMYKYLCIRVIFLILLLKILFYSMKYII